MAVCGLGIYHGLSVRASIRSWEVLVRPILEYNAESGGGWREAESLGSESEDNKGGSLGGAGMGPARRASKFNPTTILGKNSKNGSDKTMQENLRSAYVENFEGVRAGACMGIRGGRGERTTGTR